MCAKLFTAPVYNVHNYSKLNAIKGFKTTRKRITFSQIFVDNVDKNVEKGKNTDREADYASLFMWITVWISE